MCKQKYPKQAAVINYNENKPFHIFLISLVVAIDLGLLLYVIYEMCKTNNLWCYLPLALFSMLFPWLFFKRRAQEITVDAETLEMFYKNNDLDLFKKYHMLESEFAKIDFKKYLKLECLTAVGEDVVCKSDNESEVVKLRRKGEIIAHKLNHERELRAKQVVNDYKVDPIEIRTTLLAEQIDVPEFDKHINKK